MKTYKKERDCGKIHDFATARRRKGDSIKKWRRGSVWKTENWKTQRVF